MSLGGSAEIRHGDEGHVIRFGETLLLPAAIGECDVVPVGGEATLITCVVP
jgi:hypothetical protein